MTETSDPQHQFPVWLRKLLNKDDQDIAAKLQMVGELAQEATSPLLRFLVTMSFQGRARPAEGADLFRKICARSLPGIELSNGSAETRLVCSAALAQVIFQDEANATDASLMIVCAAFGGRHPSCPVNLVERAGAHLQSKSIENEKRPEINTSEFDGKLSVATDAIVASVASPDGDGDPDVIANKLAKAVQASFGLLGEAVAKFSRDANRRLDILDEEVDMLWWYFNGFDETAGKKFSDIPSDARAIVLPKRLAELTCGKPGPRSLEALLYRAGLPHGCLTVPQCVNACEIEWLSRIVRSENSDPVTQPILLALQRRFETRDEESWIGAWAGATGLNTNTTTAAAEIAQQLYRELLLERG